MAAFKCVVLLFVLAAVLQVMLAQKRRAPLRYNNGNNGYRSNNGNGYRNNGYRNNGYRYNVYRSNGYRDNGYRNNGYRDNGYGSNGYRDNGYDNNGYRDNGNGNNGYRDNGNGNNGYSSNGYGSNGYFGSFLLDYPDTNGAVTAQQCYGPEHKKYGTCYCCPGHSCSNDLSYEPRYECDNGTPCCSD